MSSIPLHYTDFSGGLNTLEQHNLLNDTQCRDVNNVQGTAMGAIVKRTGLVTFASPASVLTGLYACEATNSPFLIGAGGTSIYSINTSGTVSTIGTGLTSGKRWEWIQGPVVSGQGPLYGMNGVDTPRQWTGSGSVGNWTSTSGSVAVPNGTYMTYAQNQVYVAGVSSNPSRVYFSAIGDPTNWDPTSNLGAGFLDFDPDDGSAITGLGTVGPYVLVAKRRKLFVVTQPGNAAVASTVRRLSTNIGCVAHRSIAEDENGTYFLAEDRNVYLTNGSKIEPIADIIQPTVDGIVDRTQSVGVCYNSHYYLSVGLSGAAPDTTLDWDTVLKSWWKHTFASNEFTIWHPTGKPGLYSAKSTSAVVDQCFVPNVWTDNGTPVQWSWYGPWQSPSFYRRRLYPTTYFRKNLRQTRVEGSGTVDYYIASNFEGGMGTQRGSDVLNTNSAEWGDTAFLWGDTRLLWGNPSVVRNRFFSIGVADAWSQIFTATSDNPAEVDSYTLFISDRKDMVPA
jgi:hypothetical protein